MTFIEAAKQALEALEAHADIGIKSDKAITALNAAIEQAGKQAPVPWSQALESVWAEDDTVQPAQTEPEFECPRCGHCCAQRQWVGLTDEQISQYDYQYRDLLYDAEKMLRENNA